MFKVEKSEPVFFNKAKRKIKNPNESSAWANDNIKNIRRNLAIEILEEQNNLCIYCEKLVESYPKYCHIDHFKKRDFFPKQTLNYDNLVISCNNENRCAKYKDKNISKEDYEKIINPVIENPENFLEYTMCGELEAKSDLNDYDKEKAEFTIKILNLNERSLVEERKNVIKQLSCIINEIETIEQLSEYGFKNFLTLSKWILNKGTQIDFK